MVTPSGVTATSATIGWTLQEYSLDVNQFRISLERTTGSDDNAMLCSDADVRPAVTVAATGSSMGFSGLQEFSTYTVTLLTDYSGFGDPTVMATRTFTTLAAGMYDCMQ